MTESKPPEEDRFIGAEGTEAPGESRRSGEARLREIEEELDAALACTFPASDPIGSFGRDRSAPEVVPEK